MNTSTWKCPACAADNTADSLNQKEVRCSNCGSDFAAEPEAAPIANPTAPKAKEKRKRSKAGWLATALFVLLGILCGLSGFASKNAVECLFGLGFVAVAAVYHIGERLDLILSELQDLNDR